VAVTAGRVTLAGPGGAPRYQGALQELRDEGAGVRLRSTLQGPGGRLLVVQSMLQITPDGHVDGTMQGTSD
jgi:hypothetical protein